MFKFIWKLFKPWLRSLPDSPGLEKRVEELQADLNRIAADLATISNQMAGQPWEVIVEKIVVDKVTLDQIVFNVDGLDVKDLSGSLSIGLNYGGRVIRMETPKKTKTPEYAQEKDQNGKQPAPAGEQSKVKVSFKSSAEEGVNSEGGQQSL